MLPDAFNKAEAYNVVQNVRIQNFKVILKVV